MGHTKQEPDAGRHEERDQTRNLTSDDMPRRDIYEDVFFGEVMSPYTAAGLGKLQWAECQVKANCTYLQNISSAKKKLETTHHKRRCIRAQELLIQLAKFPTGMCLYTCIFCEAF